MYALILQMRDAIQSNLRISAFFVFFVGYVGFSWHSCDTTISTSWVSVRSVLLFYYSIDSSHIIIVNMFVILHMTKWADDSNFYETLPLVVVVFWVYAFIFLLCEPGTAVTAQFGIFGEELGRCNWYALPSDIQRMYAIFLSDTQNSVKLFGYGNILCERETSKIVCISCV